MGHFRQPGSEAAWVRGQHAGHRSRGGPPKKNKNKKSPARIKLRGICSTHRYWNYFLSFYFETPLSPILAKKVRYKGKKKKAWSANDYYLNKSVETPVESKSPSNRQASFKSSWTRRKSTHNAPFFCCFFIPRLSISSKPATSTAEPVVKGWGRGSEEEEGGPAFGGEFLNSTDRRDNR